MSVLVLAVAAGVGVAVRFVVSSAVGGHRGTLLVNVVGCALLGLLVESSLAPVALGFAGGLTTFSTWAVETVEGGGWRYATTTTALCLLAAGAGLAMADLLTG